MTSKVCCACKQDLLLAEFYIDKRGCKSGRCKKCISEYYKIKYMKEADKYAQYREKNKEKSKQYFAQKYLEDPESAKERSAKFYRENKEHCYEVSRAYKKKHKEKNKKYQKDWKDRNPEQAVADASRRRARKRNSEGSYTKEHVLSLYKKQKEKCVCCSTCLKNGYHVDHIIPLAKGGSNSHKNIQLLCPPCNLQKSSKDPIQFMQSKGFLL